MPGSLTSSSPFTTCTVLLFRRQGGSRSQLILRRKVSHFFHGTFLHDPKDRLGNNPKTWGRGTKGNELQKD